MRYSFGMAQVEQNSSAGDDAAGAYLHERVAGHVRSLIADGSLRPGDRVPSLRSLRQRFGVSLSTVTRAYETLERHGWIEARPQSGFYARDRAALEPDTPQGGQTTGAVAGIDRRAMARAVMSGADEDVVMLAMALPAPEHLPVKALNRSLRRVLRERPDELVRYALAPGIEPLRRQIAQRAVDLGCHVRPDEVVVTTGCSEALALALRSVAGPGDVIAVESPTFFKILSVIESLGMRVLELPTDPVGGVDAEALEQAFARNRVRAALLQPSFNNPLGSLVDDAARERIVASAARHGKPVIEDDIYGDLHFDERRPVPLRAFDADGWVLTASSFSKTIAPGYRIGWLLPGRFLERAVAVQQDLTFAGAAPTQLAVADFLETGGYARHLRRVRAAYRDQVAQMRGAIARAFPAGTRVSQPAGGFVLWVELPAGSDGTAVYRRAFSEGIRVAPGTLFSCCGDYGRYLRLSAGMPWSETIGHAVARLGRIAAEAGA